MVLLEKLTIGSFFFENEQGAAITFNGQRYRAMLNAFLLLKIEEEILILNYGRKFIRFQIRNSLIPI